MQAEQNMQTGQFMQPFYRFTLIFTSIVWLYQIIGIIVFSCIDKKDFLDNSYKIDIFVGLMFFTNVLNFVHFSVKLVETYKIYKDIQHKYIDLDIMKFVLYINVLFLMIQIIFGIVNVSTNNANNTNKNIVPCFNFSLGNIFIMNVIVQYYARLNFIANEYKNKNNTKCLFTIDDMTELNKLVSDSKENPSHENYQKIVDFTNSRLRNYKPPIYEPSDNESSYDKLLSEKT